MSKTELVKSRTNVRHQFATNRDGRQALIVTGAYFGVAGACRMPGTVEGAVRADVVGEIPVSTDVQRINGWAVIA
jgi:hypothetical protein